MNKSSKIILGIAGVVVILGILIFVLGQPSREPAAPQEIVSKAQDKTYLKYVALDNGEESTTTPLATPTESVTPTPEEVAENVTPTEEVTQSPSPTEIIVALTSPTGEASGEAQVGGAEPTTIAELPTTGIIEGSIVIFLIAASMIVFAFVL